VPIRVSVKIGWLEMCKYVHRKIQASYTNHLASEVNTRMVYRRPRRALIFGRFQPFHKGHLSIVRWALEERGFEEVVLLVGMASENYTPRNPFTAGERIEMIRLSMMDAGIPLERIITATIRTLETSIGSVHYVLSYVPKVYIILTRTL
jgi:cytidyltransferase-like protein